MGCENCNGATEEDGVFIFEADAETMAEEAAKKIRQLEGDLRRLRQRLHAR